MFMPVWKKNYQRKEKYKNTLFYDYWSKKRTNAGGNIYKFRKHENGTELEGLAVEGQFVFKDGHEVDR